MSVLNDWENFGMKDFIAYCGLDCENTGWADFLFYEMNIYNGA